MEQIVKYLNTDSGNYSFYQKPAPYFYSASGYGSKIPCNQMVIDLTTKRHYRVYAICYSNAGSLYIIKNKERVFIRC